jgi:hypothetical protein
MITEEILEELTCASSDERHFVIEPLNLSNCCHSICKSCISSEDIKEIKCKLCGLVSKQDFTKFQASNTLQKLLQTCIGDVFKILETETCNKLNELKCNYQIN